MRLKNEVRQWQLLLREVPSVTVSLFVLSVVTMNLLANKSIVLPVDWLALDCGILVSWAAFLSMDLITRSFGPGAANRLSLLAILFNLACCAVFSLVSLIPGVWSASFVPQGAAINAALDQTFGGTWYILGGSTLAFLVSALVNNSLNWAIGRSLRTSPDGFSAFALRTWLSTALGQFVDNLTFALVVSRPFFGWTLLQCLTCALTGMAAELLCEMLFTPLGFQICRRWQAAGIGAGYRKEMGLS